MYSGNSYYPYTLTHSYWVETVPFGFVASLHDTSFKCHLVSLNRLDTSVMCLDLIPVVFINMLFSLSAFTNQRREDIENICENSSLSELMYLSLYLIPAFMNSVQVNIHMTG